MADAGRKKKTLEETYQKKTQLEHILIRPDTYIGSVEEQTERIWVWDSHASEMVLRDVTFVPGLYKIFDEILVNAADNKQRDRRQDKIKVDINAEIGYVKVWNNGEGIPVQIHKEHKMYIPEMIFGHLLTGSNYDDNEKKTTGGRNGYGAKLANIFSKKFVVETSHRESGHCFKKIWRDNMTKSDPAIVDRARPGEADYTSITFFPDFQKFRLSHLNSDHVALMTKRVYDVAGNTSSDLRVYLNGARLSVSNFEQYVDLFPGMGEEKRKESFAVPNSRWQICVRPSNIDYQQVSFVNSIWTIKGGKHVQYIVDQVIEKVIESVKKKNKKLEIKPHMVKQFLWVFVNAQIENPAFDSQTKETLNTLKGKFGSTCEVPPKMIEALCKVINERVAMRANDKLDRAMAAKVAGAKSGRLMGIPKLEDANDAGGKNGRYCTLILTEGDSAKALVLAGMSEIGRDRFGVFPLRGKLLNVREAGKKQCMENKEIQALIKIVGLKMGHDYRSVDGLRYGCVMIMTDQDTDGSHIKGLLINFFHTFWPGLLQVPGFLVQFITPVVKAFVANKKRIPTEGISFYNIPDMLAFKEDAEKRKKRYEYKYYKGLGSSDNSEAKQYFSEMENNRIDFQYDRNSGNDDRAIKLAFAKDHIDARKVWITSHSVNTPGVDFKKVKHTGLTYSEFINKDLILFSIADCERSIPNVMDGLKPGQRKALWACFKRNLTKEIRVAQLTGYVSEKACYHHGEVSMQGAIIGMAQDFVGSNNLPLLVPCGQFGSRALGGKDHASARYIHTKLASIARALFPKTDDYLLDYRDDDGTAVEPEWYVPIIPFALVNGCSGIGTGFATFIPNYNPRDLVRNVRNLIRGEEQQAPLVPWYRGLKTDTTVAGEGKFHTHGKVNVIDRRVVRITELPAKVWTDELQKTLLDLQERGFISEYRDHTTGDGIDVDVGFNADVLSRLAGQPGALEDLFGLRSSISATNLVCFDKSGRLKKYDSAEQIVQEWYYVRLEYYHIRKKYMVDELQRTCEKLRNMVRFIREVNENQIKVQKRKKRDLLIELRNKKYTPFPPVSKLKLNKQSVQNDDADGGEDDDPTAKYFAEKKKDKDEDAEEQKMSHDYDYLLGMKIWSLTYERARQLEEQLKNAEEDLKKLKATSEKQMWTDDLANLEGVMRKTDAEWEEAQGKTDGGGGDGGGFGGGGRRRKKKVQKERLNGMVMKPQNLSEQNVKEIHSWIEKCSEKKRLEKSREDKPRKPKKDGFQAPETAVSGGVKAAAAGKLFNAADDDFDFGCLGGEDDYLGGGGGAPKPAPPRPAARQATLQFQQPAKPKAAPPHSAARGGVDAALDAIDAWQPPGAAKPAAKPRGRAPAGGGGAQKRRGGGGGRRRRKGSDVDTDDESDDSDETDTSSADSSSGGADSSDGEVQLMAASQRREEEEKAAAAQRAAARRQEEEKAAAARRAAARREEEEKAAAARRAAARREEEEKAAAARRAAARREEGRMHAGLSREEERGGRRAAPPPFSDMRPNVSVDDQRAGAKRRPAASPLGGDAKKARPKEKNFINVDDDDDLLHFDESKFGLAGMLGGASKEKPKPPPKVAAAPAAGARKKSFVCDSDTDDDGGAPAPKPKKAGGDDWLNWDG